MLPADYVLSAAPHLWACKAGSNVKMRDEGRGKAEGAGVCIVCTYVLYVFPCTNYDFQCLNSNLMIVVGLFGQCQSNRIKPNSHGPRFWVLNS